MSHIDRRQFVQMIGAATAYPAAPTTVGIVTGSAAPPVLWATQQLSAALVSRGLAVRRYGPGETPPAGQLVIRESGVYALLELADRIHTDLFGDCLPNYESTFFLDSDATKDPDEPV